MNDDWPADGPGAADRTGLDVTRPHSARVWNYWIGGKDHFPVDRAVGDGVMAAYPDIVEIARQSRLFLSRVVRFLVQEAGIDQFLDLGTGLPTANTTHEVAQGLNPAARIVYVDNDPLVLAHARALLTSTEEGGTDYIDADVRNVEEILAAAGHTLDLGRPVAVMMLGILGNIADYQEAQQIARRFTAAVPAGPYLVVNDGTKDANAAVAQAAADLRADAGDPYRLSTPGQIAGYLTGLELVEPGVVHTADWRPDPREARGKILDVHCAVARKP
jgi:S-adenosyl methyltransferase